MVDNSMNSDLLNLRDNLQYKEKNMSISEQINLSYIDSTKQSTKSPLKKLDHYIQLSNTNSFISHDYNETTRENLLNKATITLIQYQNDIKRLNSEIKLFQSKYMNLMNNKDNKMIKERIVDLEEKVSCKRNENEEIRQRNKILSEENGRINKEIRKLMDLKSKNKDKNKNEGIMKYNKEKS